MNKKKINSNISLWWLDFSVLNLNSLQFKYSLINNIYILDINKNFFSCFFLINKKNITSLNFYTLDILNYKSMGINNYYLSYQSIFFDFKILIETKFTKNLNSISTIYNSCVWLERETKEFSKINYTNLIDTRKLLSNYNYNYNLQYNNYNNIINDLKI